MNALCGCRARCGDDGDTEGPGTCKGLPRLPEQPLVQIVLVPRKLLAASPVSGADNALPVTEEGERE